MPRPVRCRRIGQMPAFRSFSPDDMGQLVSGYLDFAERRAEREQAMTMAVWARHLDGILTLTGEKLLIGAGSVSHEAAMTKAETEYKKYKDRVLSGVEKDYLQSVKELGKISGKA